MDQLKPRGRPERESPAAPVSQAHRRSTAMFEHQGRAEKVKSPQVVSPTRTSRALRSLCPAPATRHRRSAVPGSEQPRQAEDPPGGCSASGAAVRHPSRQPCHPPRARSQAAPARQVPGAGPRACQPEPPRARGPRRLRDPSRHASSHRQATAAPSRNRRAEGPSPIRSMDGGGSRQLSAAGTAGHPPSAGVSRDRDGC